MVHINISYRNNVLYDISFVGKFCVIQGCSGVGKTSLISTILDRVDAYTYKMTIDGEELKSEDIALVGYVALTDRVVDAYKEDRVLLIIDDEDEKYIGSKLFDLLKNSKRARYLILSREYRVSSIGSYAINYSINNVYQMYTVNNTHKIIKYSDLLKRIEVTTSNIYGGSKKVVICEDSKSGLRFYRKFFNSEVIPIRDRRGNISGKNTAVEFIKMVLLEYDSVIIILDWCSFGSEMPQLLNLLEENKHKQILLTVDILSFEYLLLNSKIVSEKMDLMGVYLNEQDLIKHESEEKYYESILEQVTKTEVFYQKHGSSLSRCYIEPCCFDKRLSDVCSYWINDRDKINGLFKDSRLSKILELRRY